MGKLQAKIELPDYTLSLFNIKRKDLSIFVKKSFVIEQYRRGTISLGKAGELLGLTKREMMVLIWEYQVPINYDVEDLEEDLKTLKPWLTV